MDLERKVNEILDNINTGIPLNINDSNVILDSLFKSFIEKVDILLKYDVYN